MRDVDAVVLMIARCGRDKNLFIRETNQDFFMISRAETNQYDFIEYHLVLLVLLLCFLVIWDLFTVMLTSTGALPPPLNP